MIHLVFIMLREISISQKQLDNFCQRHHIRQLSLFGSYLRDDFGPDSDIDVLVEFEREAPIGFLALARIQRELTELLGRKVDVVPAVGLKSTIRDSVLNESEVVYATG